MTFVCTKCDSQFPKWQGRCPECQAWGTVEAQGAASKQGQAKAKNTRLDERHMIDLATVAVNEDERLVLGIDAVDRVLGGGVVAGSLVLLGGQPGIGKSTLVLQIAEKCITAKKSVMYVAGEESPAQIKKRSERLGLAISELTCITSTNIDAVITTITKVKPGLLIVDSVQTVWTETADGTSGGVTQVRAVTTKLLQAAKETGVAIILIGHVTKDGSVAGPKTLEHLVDTVLYLEGKRLEDIRLLRSVKNRFGPSGEVGVLKMCSHGLMPVDKSAHVFVFSHEQVPGTVQGATVDGSQVFFFDVSVLLEKSYGTAYPKRIVTGYDQNRLAILLAILHRFCSIDLSGYDVYVQVRGNFKKNDPHFDLPLCMAVYSAMYMKAIKNPIIAVGEIGLNGTVRQLGDEVKIIREAGQFGMSAVVCGAGKKKITSKTITVQSMTTIAELDSIMKSLV